VLNAMPGKWARISEINERMKDEPKRERRKRIREADASV
jgi:hypothetical protein